MVLDDKNKLLIKTDIHQFCFFNIVAFTMINGPVIFSLKGCRIQIKLSSGIYLIVMVTR